jgi:glycosyltransferase involved in cell wall biosynthesis
MLVARIMAKLEPGGAQLSAIRLTRTLERNGIACRFIAGDATPAGLRLAREHRIEVESFADGLGLQWTPSRAFAAWLVPRLRGADLVHAHMFGAWWAAAQVLANDVPLVASEHNAFAWPGPPHAREARDALSRVDRFFAHGPAPGAYVRALGLPLERLAVGLSPVQGFSSRSRADLPTPRIVFAGRLAPDKGADLLLEALGRMAGPPPAYLLGTGVLEPALRERAAALGIGDVVHLPGWQRRPGRWIAGAAALVVPSREESWSQSAVLAMGLGVPVVAFAVEALPDVLGSGRGVLVPPGDVDALARAIEDVLAGRRRPDLDAGRRFAAQFTPARVAPRYAAAYEELVGRARARRTSVLTARASASPGGAGRRLRNSLG